jgi:hypothetical protein
VIVANSLRGPGNGLPADFYNWQDPYGFHDPSRRRTWTPTPTPQSPNPATPTPSPTTWGRYYISQPAELSCTPNPPIGEQINQIGTLDFLRLGRDQGRGLIFIVNTRGFPNWYNWPYVDVYNGNDYVTTDLNKLEQLASDWVLYTHYTVQRFNTSHTPDPQSADPLEQRSAEIVNNLIHWQYCDGQPARPVLPEPGEWLPEPIYWEIGNEPEFTLGGVSFSASQYFTRYGVWRTPTPGPTPVGLPDPATYVGLTNALLKMDWQIHGRTTIKVGPTLMKPNSVDNNNNSYLNQLVGNGGKVDFVSYHPYDNIYGYWYCGSSTCYTYYQAGTPLPNNANTWTSAQKASLRDKISLIYYNQQQLYIDAGNRAPGAESLVTEWNPSHWRASWSLYWRGKSMAQALGVMETVFSYARLGVRQAYFYTLPGLDATTSHPTYKTFAFLKEHLGDRLLKVYDNNNPNCTLMS